jgi:hypothetical protein
LVEGVPEYLGIALKRWVARYVGLHWCREVALQLHVAWEWNDPMGALIALDPDSAGRDFAAHVLEVDPPTLLDVLDCVLHSLMADARREDPGNRRGVVRHVMDLAGDLEGILTQGGSAWCVSTTCDGLERRVDETARDAVNTAMGSAASARVTSAAEHLRNAWRWAYGRNPNPLTSYMEAVMAVESAGRFVISPKNDTATLGTMIADLGNKPSKWEFVLSDKAGLRGIEPVVGLMERLWQGQVRHGGTPTPAVSQREAEAALHVSATLVQWFASGAVSRIP